MNVGPLVRAYTDWDRWCRKAATQRRRFGGNEGKTETARLVSELIQAADRLGTTHTRLREQIVAALAAGATIEQAVTAACHP